MAVGIMSDKYNERAVMYCTSTDWSFGPVHHGDFNASQELQMFINSLVRDPRELDEAVLEGRYHDFRKQLHHCECGEPLLWASLKCDVCGEDEDEDEEYLP